MLGNWYAHHVEDRRRQINDLGILNHNTRLDGQAVCQENAVHAMCPRNAPLHCLNDLMAAKLVLAKPKILQATGDENNVGRMLQLVTAVDLLTSVHRLDNVLAGLGSQLLVGGRLSHLRGGGTGSLHRDRRLRSHRGRVPVHHPVQ